MARVIRFLFEHGHPWPLWESGTDEYTMEPSDYGLSDELADRLRKAWDLWNRYHSVETGWDSAEPADQWLQQTEQALAILRREVADFAEVRDERHPAPNHPERAG